MPRRAALLALVVALAAALVIAVVAHRRASEAERLIAAADARLHADLVAAPDLDRLQAATAASQLERARSLLLRSHPDVESLYRQALAVERLQRGDYVRARSEIEAARRLRRRYDLDLRVLSGTVRRVVQDRVGAEADAAAALELDPRAPRALLLAGDLALDRRDGPAALGYFERLVAVAPEASVSHDRLGLALELVGRYDDAERAYGDALERNGRDLAALVNLGRAVGRRGDLAGSKVAFDQAIAVAPTDPQAWLGSCLAIAGLADFTRADEVCRRAAELDPGDPAPLVALGDIRRAHADVEGAIALYREALGRRDDDVVAWVKLGNLLVAANDPRGAERAFREAIARAPALGAAHNGLGAALLHQRRFDEARAELERAASLDPLDANPLLNLALVFERSGDAHAAREAYEQALARDPDSDVALAKLVRRR